MTVETQPVMPAETGNVSIDVKARHEHFAALTNYFERNPQAGLAVQQKHSLSSMTTGTMPNKFDAAPAARVPAPNPAVKVREFDAEMRATGLQRSDGPIEGEPDQLGLDFLVALKRNTPAEQRTEAWEKTWLSDYASVIEGRQFGETPAQFAARKTGAAPAAATTEQGTPVLPAELSTAVESLSKASNDGRAVHTAFPPVLLSGYTLPPGSYDSVATVTELKAARAAGITQAQVDAVIRSRLSA